MKILYAILILMTASFSYGIGADQVLLFDYAQYETDLAAAPTNITISGNVESPLELPAFYAPNTPFWGHGYTQVSWNWVVGNWQAWTFKALKNERWYNTAPYAFDPPRTGWSSGTLGSDPITISFGVEVPLPDFDTSAYPSVSLDSFDAFSPPVSNYTADASGNIKNS